MATSNAAELVDKMLNEICYTGGVETDADRSALSKLSCDELLASVKRLRDKLKEKERTVEYQSTHLKESIDEFIAIRNTLTAFKSAAMRALELSEPLPTMFPAEEKAERQLTRAIDIAGKKT